jgi:hypothetical protein
MPGKLPLALHHIITAPRSYEPNIMSFGLKIPFDIAHRFCRPWVLLKISAIVLHLFLERARTTYQAKGQSHASRVLNSRPARRFQRATAALTSKRVGKSTQCTTKDPYRGAAAR